MLTLSLALPLAVDPSHAAPDINNLPADYAGSVDIRNDTRRYYLTAAGNDPSQAGLLLFQTLYPWYAVHDPSALPALDQLWEQMLRGP